MRRPRSSRAAVGTVCALPGLSSCSQLKHTMAARGACGLPVAGELIAAAVRGAAEHHPDRGAFLVRAGREVADLFRQDYELASSIIRRIRIAPTHERAHR